MFRYKFPAICPYCNKHSDWLFGAEKIGENFVGCVHCGKTYAILINLIPETVCTYSLVPHTNK